jgi:hypothetical protein
MKKMLLAATVLAGMASPAFATTIVLDDFSVASGPRTTAGSDVTAITGASRTIGLSGLASTIAPAEYSVQSTGGSAGILNVTNGVGDDSTVTLNYALSAPISIPVGATNVALSIEIVASDGNPTSIDVAMGTFAGNFNIPANTLGSILTFNIGSIALINGATALSVTFNGAPGWDLAADNLGLSFDDPPVVTSEPATLAVMGAGLLGLAALRRRRKAA